MSNKKSSLPSDPDIPGLTAGSLALLKDQIENGHNAFTIVCGVSFNSFEEYEDSRDSYNQEYNLGPHVRTLLLRDLHAWGWTTLHDFLSKKDHAQTIGYDPEKFAAGNTAPDRTAISRAWNDYLGDSLKNTITALGEWVREYARATGNLIGDLMVDPEDRSGNSERTRYRIKRELAHETADKFRDLFYEQLNLNLPDTAQFTEEDLYDFFLHIALTGDFANNGADTWREEVDDESTAPSGDTFRRYVRMFDELEENEVTELFDAIDELLWEIAEQRDFINNLAVVNRQTQLDFTVSETA
jgi:hypothetical protein